MHSQNRQSRPLPFAQPPQQPHPASLGHSQQPSSAHPALRQTGASIDPFGNLTRGQSSPYPRTPPHPHNQPQFPVQQRLPQPIRTNSLPPAPSSPNSSPTRRPLPDPRSVASPAPPLQRAGDHPSQYIGHSHIHSRTLSSTPSTPIASAPLPSSSQPDARRPLPSAPLVSHASLPNDRHTPSLFAHKQQIMAPPNSHGSQGLHFRPQSRALPLSPSAPPDLSLVPPHLLRRTDISAAPAVPPKEPTHVESVSLRQDSFDRVLRSVRGDSEASCPKKLPAPRSPDQSPERAAPRDSGGSGVSSSPTKPKVNIFAPGSSSATITTVPTVVHPAHHETAPSIRVNGDEIDTNQRSAKMVASPRTVDPTSQPDSRPQRASVTSPTVINSHEPRKSIQSSPPEPKPERAPMSLTLRLAQMALDEEEGSSTKRSSAFEPPSSSVKPPTIAISHDVSLEDSPPKPFRDLSNSNTAPKVSRTPIPKLVFPDSDEDVSSEEQSPMVPSIVIGEEDVPAAPRAPQISMSAGMPALQVISMDAEEASNSRGSNRSVYRTGGLICGGCGKGIVGRIVSAMGVRWHPNCFQCTECDELLEHVSAYEHDGRPYCHLDYHEKFGPRCFHCKTPIIEEQFITLDDVALGQRMYHEQHFFCAECGDPFLAPSGTEIDDDVGFTVYRGYAYCEACHVRLRMPKCTKCKKSIRDGTPAVEALGGKWCQSCFACAGCEKPFQEPSFFQRNNKPYCESCFSIIIKNEMD